MPEVAKSKMRGSVSGKIMPIIEQRRERRLRLSAIRFVDWLRHTKVDAYVKEGIGDQQPFNAQLDLRRRGH
jgi:hypothetical protein